MSSGREEPRVAGGRRGAAMVELALVLLPLLALIFGIIDFGFAIFLRSTLQHAARQGARYAVTSRTEPGMGHDASIRSAVQRSAMGLLDGADGAAKIKIRYYVPGTLVETQSNAGGNIVEVSIEGYSWAWMAPLMRSSTAPLAILARSSDRMENSPGGIAPAR
jgi:Flp pilus assembly protein TadG